MEDKPLARAWFEAETLRIGPVINWNFAGPNLLQDRYSSRVHLEKFEPVSKVLTFFLISSLLVLSAKSISDVKPNAQRMPPTSKIMRNLTSSTVLLPGSVLMQQRNEGNQGKCHWNLSKFKTKGVEWFHFRKSASFLWHIHGEVFP